MYDLVTERFETYCEKSIQALRSLKSKSNLQNFNSLVSSCVNTIKSKKIIAVAGNGGSHADSIHFAAELVNQFTYKHEGFPVMALAANSAIVTSWANDKSFESQLSRELEAFKYQIGLLVCLTTSGKSKNITNLIRNAKKYQIPVAALCSNRAAKYLPTCDYLICVDSHDTPVIQESHVVIYHSLCREIEFQLSGKILINR